MYVYWKQMLLLVVSFIYGAGHCDLQREVYRNCSRAGNLPCPNYPERNQSMKTWVQQKVSAHTVEQKIYMYNYSSIVDILYRKVVPHHPHQSIHQWPPHTSCWKKNAMHAYTSLSLSLSACLLCCDLWMSWKKNAMHACMNACILWRTFVIYVYNMCVGV